MQDERLSTVEATNYMLEADMSRKKRKTILLAGGGSAGHVMPLVSVVEAIKGKYDTVFIIEKNGVEENVLKKRNIIYYGILAGKWRRYWSWQNFIDIFKVIIGIFQSIYLLFKIKPDVVLAKGGYVSIPVSVACWFWHIPLVSHESDAIMGLANKFTARIARKIGVAFPVGVYGGVNENKLVWVGMPVRKFEMDGGDLIKIGKYFGINNDLPVVFVTGGSQGAVNLNSYILKNIKEILKFCNVIHITGKKDFDRVKKIKEELELLPGKYLVYDFMYDDYGRAIVLADIVISRAGSTLAEISFMAKPSILVPLPTSASNHQYYNAKSFEDVGASIMIEERDFNKVNLAILLQSVLSDEERMEEMKAAATTAMMTEGSAQMMLDLIESVMNGEDDK